MVTVSVFDSINPHCSGSKPAYIRPGLYSASRNCLHFRVPRKPVQWRECVASSVCARGRPNIATTASPMNFPSVPNNLRPAQRGRSCDVGEEHRVKLLGLHYCARTDLSGGWNRELAARISSNVTNSSPIALDQAREDRIDLDITADCYGVEEQALGWYYYLEGLLRFPFQARCTARLPTSPLRPGDEVQVTSLALEDECQHAMFVTISWGDDSLDVPLSQLEPVEVDEGTAQGVGDWLYWVRRGYEL